jgi:hypothetical protein
VNLLLLLTDSKSSAEAGFCPFYTYTRMDAIFVMKIARILQTSSEKI